MNDITCKHISYDDIVNYLNMDEDDIFQNNLSSESISFIEEFNDKLNNCSICCRRLREYALISPLTGEEWDKEAPASAAESPSVAARKTPRILFFGFKMPRKIYNSYNSDSFLVPMVVVVSTLFFIISFILSNIMQTSKLGPQVNDAWILSYITAPEKMANGISYIPVEDGIRIGLLSLLEGRPRGATNIIDSSKATIRHYSRAIRSNKNNADLYISRGIAYTLNGYLEAGIKDFTKAIELDPKNASAYYNRAIANAGFNLDIDTIITDLKAVITIKPGDKETLYTIGVLYFRQYKIEETAALLEATKDAFSNEHLQGYKDVNDYLNFLNIDFPPH